MTMNRRLARKIKGEESGSGVDFFFCTKDSTGGQKAQELSVSRESKGTPPNDNQALLTGF